MADVVILLVPRWPTVTKGAWWEGGVADALGIPVVASGSPGDRATMIFLSRVREVDTDEEAIAYVDTVASWARVVIERREVLP